MGVPLTGVNFDLYLVGIAVAGIVLLGTMVYMSNTKSITNQTFLFFSLLTALWGVSNYLEYRFTTIDATLWALRFHLFLSTIHAFVFFQLAYVFPRDTVRFPAWYRYALIPSVVAVAIIVLTPAVFTGIVALAPVGQVTRATPGPGIALFMATAFGLLLGALGMLLRRTLRARGVERRQELALFVGMTLTAVLILFFNVLLPNAFSNLSYIPFAALFILPFVALTSYAIHRHHLFNVKVATTAILGFMVSIFTFVNILYSTGVSATILNITAFVIVLLGSVKTVADMITMRKLTEELGETNERQKALMRFVTHEVKGFLTKDQGAFSALLDGDFGKLSDELRPFVERALAETRGGVSSVMDILVASNQSKGTTQYEKEVFDFAPLIETLVEHSKQTAEAKGLTLEFKKDAGEYRVLGDKNELTEHVVRNLIDNAVNYTPKGSIVVTLSHDNGSVVVRVTDSGVGVSPEDRKMLFTEGGHGKESQKINVHSTGYGLFIAKNIVDAHEGTIVVASDGSGKGSTFTVTLPAAT